MNTKVRNKRSEKLSYIMDLKGKITWLIFPSLYWWKSELNKVALQSKFLATHNPGLQSFYSLNMPVHIWGCLGSQTCVLSYAYGTSVALINKKTADSY